MQQGTPIFKTVQEEHLSRWAKQYFYDQLMEEGFRSYQDKGLSWYKVLDDSIVQTVYLFSCFSGMIMHPELGFGCHPLIVPAKLPQKLVDPSAYGWDNVIMSVRKFPGPFVLYTGSLVEHSRTPQAGAELLDEIVFPYFSGLNTLEDAYQAHKSYYVNKLDPFFRDHPLSEFNGLTTCREFVDEVIYMGDWDMLPYIERDLDLSWCRAVDRQRVTGQREAVYGDGREAFLRMLEARKKRFLTRLAKHVDLP